MSEFNTTLRDRPSVRPDMAMDAGLRAFMLGVYNKMGLGLGCRFAMTAPIDLKGLAR